MNSLIRAIPFLGLAFAPALVAAGCKPVENTACDVFDCSFEGDEGVRIALTNAVERFTPSFPVTVTSCAGERCADATLKLDGKNIACTSEDIRVECTVKEDGSVELRYAVTIPEVKVPVRVVVKDKGGKTVFEETQTVSVQETKPADLDCPRSCREAAVTFAVPPASQ